MKVSCKQNQSKKNTSDNGNQMHPIFNIHIHVPQFDPTASVVYLPQIQPVIHLHFDEFSANPEINKRLNEKSFEKKITNFYKMSEPKFGDVKLYFGNGNKSKEKNLEESEIANVSPCSSQGPYIDTEPNEYDVREKIQNGCLDKNDVVTRRNSNNSTLKANSKNSKNLKMNSKYMLNKNFKLKEARVVLTDILKSKKYKCAAVASANSDSVVRWQDIKNDSSSTSLHPVENISESALEFENQAIKLETESNNDQPLALDWDENNSGCSKNDFVDNLNNHDAAEISNKSKIVETPSKNRSFTSMVEGLNFSEILNRFRGHKDKFIDLLKLSNCRDEHETPNVENSVQEYSYEMNEKSEFKSFEENEAEYDFHTSFDIKEMVISQDDNLDGNAAMENSSFLTIREKIDDLNTHNISDYKESGMHYVACSTPKDTECERVQGHYKISRLESDCFEIISKKQSNSENMDLDVVKLDSSDKMPLPVEENNTDLKDKIKDPFTIISNPKIQLKLIRKEFQRRGLCMTSHEIKKKQMSETKYASDTTSSQRGMKCSGSRPKGKETVKSSATESYIALEASGPTNFGVTPLNQVTPYKMHAAKNFKNEMLFGSRIKRFSSPKDLKMYKLKQQASRKS